MLTVNEIDPHTEFREFLNGPIYWSAATGAHPVVNSFLNRWNLNGYETGRLKYPTTDEIVLPDGGRRQEFQQGVIYVAFQNAVGSALINGPLRDKYNSIGGLTPGSSFLGYPTEDQKGLPDGQGQMARFQNGVIYWHPVHGAHPVTGLILNIWARAGYEGSPYGYPTADPSSDPANPGSATQTFQNLPIYVYGVTVPASQDDDYDCSRFDISGCAPAGGDVLNKCLQFQIPAEANLATIDGARYRLICEDFRHHIVEHFSTADDGRIPEEDAQNFLQCTTRALINGLPATSSSGREAKQTSNTSSGVQGFAVYEYDVVATIPGSLYKIYTAFTSEDGKDWGGCVRDTA